MLRSLRRVSLRDRHRFTNPQRISRKLGNARQKTSAPVPSGRRRYDFAEVRQSSERYTVRLSGLRFASGFTEEFRRGKRYRTRCALCLPSSDRVKQFGHAAPLAETWRKASSAPGRGPATKARGIVRFNFTSFGIRDWRAKGTGNVGKWASFGTDGKRPRSTQTRLSAVVRRASTEVKLRRWALRALPGCRVLDKLSQQAR